MRKCSIFYIFLKFELVQYFANQLVWKQYLLIMDERTTVKIVAVSVSLSDSMNTPQSLALEEQTKILTSSKEQVPLSREIM